MAQQIRNIAKFRCAHPAQTYPLLDADKLAPKRYYPDNIRLAAKINLMKIKNAVKAVFRSQGGLEAEYICIPINGSGLYEGEKGVYLDCRVAPMLPTETGHEFFITQACTASQMADILTPQGQFPVIGYAKPSKANFKNDSNR